MNQVTEEELREGNRKDNCVTYWDRRLLEREVGTSLVGGGDKVRRGTSTHFV